MIEPFVFSIWPGLLGFENVAIGVLRIILGYLWLKYFWHQVNPWVNSVGVIISGLLIVGLGTQLIALILTIIGGRNILHNKDLTSDYWFLVTCLSASFIFVGAGLFAFDLPI